MKFLFSTVIWGRTYVEQFLRFTVPTLLADGNITGFPWLDGSTYQILTTREDEKQIRRAPMFERLARMMRTEFIYIDDIPRHNKYTGVSLSQIESIRRAGAYDAMFFLYPDFICSAGSITKMATRIVEGYDAVCFPIPAILEEPFYEGLLERSHYRRATPDGPIYSIPPRDLVRISLDHPHPMLGGYNMEGMTHNIGPAYMLWEVPDQGWLLRAFHLHPFVIRVQKDNPDFLLQFHVSLDEEYMPRLFKATDKIYFPQDSDEFAMCSLRSHDSPQQPVPGMPSALDVARWAEQYAALLHREFVKVEFRWHHAVLKRDIWERIERRSATLTTMILDRLMTPDSVLRYEDPLSYELRRLRRRRFSYWRKPRYAEPVPVQPLTTSSFTPQMLEITSPLGRGKRSIRTLTLWALLWFKREFGLGHLNKYPGLLAAWMRCRRFLQS